MGGKPKSPEPKSVTDLKKFLTPENLASFTQLPKHVQRRIAEKPDTSRVVHGMTSHVAALDKPKKKGGPSLRQVMVHQQPGIRQQYGQRYEELNAYINDYCAERAQQEFAKAVANEAAATGDVSQYAGMSSAQGAPGPVGSSVRPANAAGPMQWQSSSLGR
ncbi:hypothetical protein [Micromonospora sp. SH-82]|uniref:hypothetical protein n=1 Tax=Micromonospora sp. SH-82 TaxID=3132938 RepID=UPI003EB9DC09